MANKTFTVCRTYVVRVRTKVEAPSRRQALRVIDMKANHLLNNDAKDWDDEIECYGRLKTADLSIHDDHIEQE